MKLVRLITSNTQNIFQVKTDNKLKTYFAGHDQNDIFDSKKQYNKNALKDKNGKIYYNMFDTEDAYFKSFIYRKSMSERNGTGSDFQNITNHKLSEANTQIINVINANNFIYMLESKTEKGHYDGLHLNKNWYDAEDIYDWKMQYGENSNYQLELNDISTTIYNYNYISSCISSKRDIPQEIDPEKAKLSTFTNIKYNTFYEINGNIYNDYESGNLAANTYKAKNQFDYCYNMSHGKCANDTANDILCFARNYIEIDKCNNQVYLKYTTNQHYSSLTSEGKTEVGDPKYMPGLTLGGQQIEVIKSINRYENDDNHKSNMYSININTNLIESIEKFNSEKITNDKISVITNNIKNEIYNNVRNLAERIQPAHTQLLKVKIK